MHVIERFRREGNVLHSDVTVDDPDVLLQPWTMTHRTRQLNTDPAFHIHEQNPCKETDMEGYSKIRH
jgi:hypothetical protein